MVLMQFANNKIPDQPAHLCRLTRALAVCIFHKVTILVINFEKDDKKKKKTKEKKKKCPEGHKYPWPGPFLNLYKIKLERKTFT